MSKSSDQEGFVGEFDWGTAIIILYLFTVMYIIILLMPEHIYWKMVIAKSRVLFSRLGL